MIQHNKSVSAELYTKHLKSNWFQAGSGRDFTAACPQDFNLPSQPEEIFPQIQSIDYTELLLFYNWCFLTSKTQF